MGAAVVDRAARRLHEVAVESFDAAAVKQGYIAMGAAAAIVVLGGFGLIILVAVLT